MPFFSFECVACGRSILSYHSFKNKFEEEDFGWMKHATCISKYGSTFTGEYDGYGMLKSEDEEYILSDSPCLYHKDCWLLSGMPTKFRKSQVSEDRGLFLDLTRYKGRKPRPEFTLVIEDMKRKIYRGNCPVCGIEFESEDDDLNRNKECKNGHVWHYCLAHSPPRIVLGRFNGSLPTLACSCNFTASLNYDDIK